MNVVQSITHGIRTPPVTITATFYSVTEEQLAAAFTEWERRYREEPERFQSEGEKLLRDTPETYGQACAPYLIALLNGQV
jgi:hypothetical protein